MPFCTNPNCPDKGKNGRFAEYRDGITKCPVCNSPLTDNPVEPDRNVKKIYNDLVSKMLIATGLKVDIDLVNKILITIGLLLIYRLLCIIHLPGADLSRLPDSLLSRYFNSARISIGALGIMPYITAYFLVEIFSLVIPPLNRWRGEKHEGRRKLTVTARWLTLVLCLVQGLGIAISLSKMTYPDGSPVLASTGLESRFIIVITLTACVFINLWIADLISSRGIGNGISMIIFTGIIFSVFSELAVSFGNTMSVMNRMDGMVKIIFMLLILFGSGAFSLFMERGNYNLEVKLKNNSNAVMPFKYNISGITPAVLAAYIILTPASVTYFYADYPDFFKYFQYGTWTYFITFTIFMAVMYFWFTAMYYNPDKIVNFLRSNNAEPVLPDGVSFEKLLDKKLTTLTIWGAAYLFVYSVLLSQGITAWIVNSGLNVIMIVSISLDIINDVKARKKYGNFVKIDEFQKPYEAGFIKNLLEQNSIPCFLEGYHHRSLYYFFGPFIGISLYVQRDKESEALKIISDHY
jgi:preprotein translocase subunit SecY